MNISEKIALYEFCKSRFGKEYHNLTSERKDFVKKLYHKINSNVENRVITQENRKIDLRVNFSESGFQKLIFQG